MAVAISSPPTTQAQDRVPWPFYRETKQTKFNPYEPRGDYRGSAVPPRRCTIAGTPKRDVLTGTGRKDVICGRGGDDVITGKGGDDTIDGGKGADRLRGGSGRDLLIGVAGEDSIWGGAGENVASGGAGADRILGGVRRDRLYGSTGGDTISGGPGPDAIVGEPGPDRISGGAGDDTLVTEDNSSDRVDGGAGTNVAIADLGSARAAQRGSSGDRLRRIQSTDPPPLAVGQNCQADGQGMWTACQASGQFGNVYENMWVTFENSGSVWGTIDYVGLHGFDDSVLIGCCNSSSNQVGLGAGHWGSSHELWQTQNAYPGYASFTVTSIQAAN